MCRTLIIADNLSLQWCDTDNNWKPTALDSRDGVAPSYFVLIVAKKLRRYIHLSYRQSKCRPTLMQKISYLNVSAIKYAKTLSSFTSLYLIRFWYRSRLSPTHRAGKLILMYTSNCLSLLISSSETKISYTCTRKTYCQVLFRFHNKVRQIFFISDLNCPSQR